MHDVRYRTVEVDGLNVFYREAGAADAPVLLLLHGFPSASHMFRDLLPLLAGKFRLIAPDLPGFGQTSQPPRENFAYTFENLANVMAQFTDKLGLTRYAVYVFDYGAPVGLRLALKNPERIAAIVTQNGNAYVEGVSEAFAPIKAYWDDPSAQNRNALRAFLLPQTTLFQYTQGVADPSTVSPDGRSLDDFYLARPGNDEIQLDLFADYRGNLAAYDAFHAYFRANKPPLLAVWGRNDPFFIPAGAEAFKRDLPHAEIRFFDTGHFALETHAREIAGEIDLFLSKVFAI